MPRDDDKPIDPEMIGPLLKAIFADLERKLGRKLTDQEMIDACAAAGIKAWITPRQLS